MLAAVAALAATATLVTTQALGTPAEAKAAAPTKEVWQKAEAAYKENPTNPLAGKKWGVYHGPQDQAAVAYDKATVSQKKLLDKIVKRPRTKWYGSYVPNSDIKKTVRTYIENSQAGDKSKLVQMAIFRMEPWEHEACRRPSTAREKASFTHWINELAAGIGSTPTLIVMQPDGPFIFCSPDRKERSRLLTWATKKLSALPKTSVYIDAGAADWCENDRGNKPGRCAEILQLTGIKYARGFALDSTHYTGPADNIRHGTKIAKILKKRGYGTKHFIIDTAKSGRPTNWLDMIPATGSPIRDNARVCRTKTMNRCVTLGIPPTARAAEAKYKLKAADRANARKYVDGFVWFGRPWLYNQADPFVMDRGLTMAKTTPWPAPR